MFNPHKHARISCSKKLSLRCGIRFLTFSYLICFQNNFLSKILSNDKLSSRLDLESLKYIYFLSQDIIIDSNLCSSFNNIQLPSKELNWVPVWVFDSRILFVHISMHQYQFVHFLRLPPGEASSAVRSHKIDC